MIICDKCRQEVKLDKIFLLKIQQEEPHGGGRATVSTYMSYELCTTCKDDVKGLIQDWEMGKKTVI